MSVMYSGGLGMFEGTGAENKKGTSVSCFIYCRGDQEGILVCLGGTRG